MSLVGDAIYDAMVRSAAEPELFLVSVAVRKNIAVTSTFALGCTRSLARRKSRFALLISLAPLALLSTQPGRSSWPATRRKPATPSASGTFTMPLVRQPVCPLLNWLKPVSTLASNLSRRGARVMKRIVPPIEPSPYSVPCGPRRTSIRAISTSGTSSDRWASGMFNEMSSR